VNLLDSVRAREEHGLITAYDVAARLVFMSLAEVGMLQEYALKLPPNSLIVNVGAGAGTSGLAFLQSRDDVRVVTVDINADGYGSLRGEENALRMAGLWESDRHRQILQDSSSTGREWSHGPVDLVFIDADHSREGALKDIEAWAPNVRPGGYLLLHDFDNLPLWPGVKQAVELSPLMGPPWKRIELVRTVIIFRRDE